MTISSLRSVLSAAALFAMAAAAQAPPDVRIALVIGNAAYASSPLKNPINDAADIASALGKLGFSVRLVSDATKAQLSQEVDAFLMRAKGHQGAVAIYFAGHAFQADDQNYIVPVDAAIRAESDMRQETLNISQTIDRLADGGARLNLLILDACRDNPFRSTKEMSGLAPKDAPRRTLLAYATEAGNVAQDGDAANGLYTAHLLKELGKPAATIDEVFKRVRFSVWRASEGRQIPGYSSGLDEPFGFEAGFKSTAQNLDARAIQFTKEKAHWDRIRHSKQAEDFFEFIDAYPESAVGELAQATLERLSRRKIIAQTPRGEAPQNPADSRFRKGDKYRMEFVVDGLPTRTGVVEVLGVENETARYSGVFGTGQIGESTMAGAVISDGSSTYDPPYVLIPGGEYQVGKRWHGRSMRTSLVAYNGSRAGEVQWMDYSARVVGRETITVPAGTFNTFRVEIDFQMQNGFVSKAVYWAQPEWGLAVKNTYNYLDARGANRRATRSLVERQRGS
jgi:hypothetical protein